MRRLRREAIAAPLDELGARVAELDVVAETPSTNDCLADLPLPADGAARICVADVQTAGRGRAGRSWLAPRGRAITFSLARTFPAGPATLGPLALVAGIGVAETLNPGCAGRILLKWPNDLVVAGAAAGEPAKLGGILIETAAADSRSLRAVIGIGINHSGAESIAAEFSRPVTDLQAQGWHRPCDETIGLLLAALIPALDDHAATGFDAAWRERWCALDMLAGRDVRVHGGDGVVTGRALGIDAHGALRVDTMGREQSFHSGEVSVRRAESE